MSTEPFDMAELARIYEMMKGRRIATTARMSHGGYEYLRDEMPAPAVSRLFDPTRQNVNLFGVRIEIDDDIPADRIVILDQHGKLLDVVLLRSGGPVVPVQPERKET